MTAYKVLEDKDSQIKGARRRELRVLLGKSEEVQLILSPWAALCVIFVKKFSFKSIFIDEEFWGGSRTR
jgi:hypothetical protein